MRRAAWLVAVVFFFSSRRRHTRCALVTGVQTCALPIFQGEKIAVLKFHSARIFIGHAEIGELRRRDDLHPWRDLLRAAKRISDKRPAHVYRRRRDAAGIPAACSPVDSGFGEDLLLAMLQVAAQTAGTCDFLESDVRRVGKEWV